MKTIYFINPDLVIQRGDFLGSGIPYMPHILAYTIGLIKKKYPIKVIDAFGQNPFKIEQHNDLYWQGISIEDIINQITNPAVIFLYASSIMNLDFNFQLIDKIRKKFPKILVIILANTQAVTSFDIRYVAKDFFKHDVDFIVYNNIEKTTLSLIQNNFQSKNLKNIIYRKDNNVKINPMSQEIGECSQLLLPAWEDFPINNYWELGYSHGPISNKFLPLLTSYGCPFHCEFCVNPSINKSRWQAKTPENIFKEIRYLIKMFDVYEFHLEDLDPTVDKNRIKKLCQLIVDNRLKISWKIVAGTKVETLDEETLDLMKEAGCSYISISPESGSVRVLKLMNKPFSYIYANKIIKHCSKLGIHTQACFVLSFPGETQSDINQTRDYIKQITKLGIDEIALFIAAPLPGNKLFAKLKGFKNYSQLTFSPKWRLGYKNIEKSRNYLYEWFVFWKTIYHPLKILQQFFNFLSGKYQTKMEMIPYRIMLFKWLLYKNHV